MAMSERRNRESICKWEAAMKYTALPIYWAGDYKRKNISCDHNYAQRERFHQESSFIIFGLLF
jgi:hypothetical protein